VAGDAANRQGAPDAREIEALQPVLIRFATRAVRDPEVAKDLVQDALLAATAQWASFARRSQVRTWVVGILSHKILDYYRRAAVRTVESQEDPDLWEAPSSLEVERVVAARRDLAKVEQAVAQLPERERLAVMMDAEGVEREEACSILGVHATHLRVLLHRGRHRLRRILERGQ
jgi:RNA polymerase sigma-70 factor (ECF subfamily)